MNMRIHNLFPTAQKKKTTYFGVFYAMSLHSRIMLKIYSAHLYGMVSRDRFAAIRKLYKGTRARVQSPDGGNKTALKYWLQCCRVTLIHYTSFPLFPL